MACAATHLGYINAKLYNQQRRPAHRQSRSLRTCRKRVSMGNFSPKSKEMRTCECTRRMQSIAGFEGDASGEVLPRSRVESMNSTPGAAAALAATCACGELGCHLDLLEREEETMTWASQSGRGCPLSPCVGDASPGALLVRRRPLMTMVSGGEWVTACRR